jgi:hypothetical protein
MGGFAFRTTAGEMCLDIFALFGPIDAPNQINPGLF